MNVTKNQKNALAYVSAGYAVGFVILRAINAHKAKKRQQEIEEMHNRIMGNLDHLTDGIFNAVQKDSEEEAP